MNFVQEIDITRRINHPGVIKSYRVITRDECLDSDINHGLLTEHVRCGSMTNNLSDDLRKVLILVSAKRILAENDFIHTDYAGDNQCQTKDGYKFIDLNGDRYVYHNNIRKFKENIKDLYYDILAL